MCRLLACYNGKSIRLVLYLSRPLITCTTLPSGYNTQYFSFSNCKFTIIGLHSISQFFCRLLANKRTATFLGMWPWRTPWPWSRPRPPKEVFLLLKMNLEPRTCVIFWFFDIKSLSYLKFSKILECTSTVTALVAWGNLLWLHFWQ